jgi:broad specificity phosphatase PhoE
MAKFLLVRHATHDLLTKKILAGRQPGVHLNDLGHEQARELGRGLASLPIEAVYCSPLERACETAAPLLRRLKLPLQTADEFNEIDFGDWTGHAFADLDRLPQWQRWNSFRSSTVAPNGESMLEVQGRGLRKMFELERQHRVVAIFSHGDLIRAILAHFLGLHLDFIDRVEIAPASVTLVDVNGNGARISLVNGTARAAAALFSQDE